MFPNHALMKIQTDKSDSDTIKLPIVDRHINSIQPKR